MTIREMSARLGGLVVFRGILQDALVQRFQALLQAVLAYDGDPAPLAAAAGAFEAELLPRGEDWSADAEETFKDPIRRQYEDQGNPYYSTARLWDDGIIEPADTRQVLALALEAARFSPLERPLAAPGYGVFRM